MIRKSKIAAGLAGVASMFLIAGTSLSAVSASAADPEPGAANCSVTGAVAGLNIPGSYTGATFVSTTLTCTGAPGSDDAGTWKIEASFSSTGSETCANGSGKGNFTDASGSDAAGGEPDSVYNGVAPDGTNTFNYTRAGATVEVDGTIDTGSGGNVTPKTAEAEHHPFHAVLTFQPTNGQCAVPPQTGQTTTANIIAPSSAVAQDA